MGKIKKIIFLSVLVFMLAAVFIAGYMYNNEGPDIENARAVPVSATDLYNTFTNDSAAAKKIYLEKILEVAGQITGMTKNQQSQAVILLKTGAAGASINCTMEVVEAGIKAGDTITIKGICNGLGQGDADLGIAPDIYLTRCNIVPQDIN